MPWSAGWSAAIDGTQSDLIKANVGFIAIDVEPGAHTIDLQYRTPFLRLGLILAIVGLVAFVFIEFIWLRRHENDAADSSSKGHGKGRTIGRQVLKDT